MTNFEGIGFLDGEIRQLPLTQYTELASGIREVIVDKWDQDTVILDQWQNFIYIICYSGYGTLFICWYLLLELHQLLKRSKALRRIEVVIEW